MKGNLNFLKTTTNNMDDLLAYIKHHYKPLAMELNEKDGLVYIIKRNEENGKVEAAIIFTKRNEDNLIKIKIVPESWHPLRYDFPTSLLEELTSTISYRADVWRKEVKKYWKEQGIEIKIEENEKYDYSDENDEWGFDEKDKEDLELKDLNNYYGTEKIWNLGGFLSKIKVTDGIKYIDNNGYGYLISDAIIAISMKYLDEPFLVVSFFKDQNGVYNLVISEDKNGDNFIKIKHQQKYECCSAKVENLKFYYENGILLLPTER